MSTPFDRSVRLYLALTLAGLGCFACFAVLLAHENREEILLSGIVTLIGGGLVLAGAIGLIVTLLKRMWAHKPLDPLPNQSPDPALASVTPAAKQPTRLP